MQEIPACALKRVAEYFPAISGASDAYLHTKSVPSELFASARGSVDIQVATDDEVPRVPGEHLIVDLLG